MIEPRSKSSPALSRRTSSASKPARKPSMAQRKPSTAQRKPSTAQRKPSSIAKPELKQPVQRTLQRKSTVKRVNPDPALPQSISPVPSSGGKVARSNTIRKPAQTRQSVTKRPTRIPSPTKSPPSTLLRTSASSSRLQSPGLRPRVSTEHLQNSPSRLVNSNSSSRLQFEDEASDTSRTNSPVKRTRGIAIKTPSKLKQSGGGSDSPGLNTRSTSLAELPLAQSNSRSNLTQALSKSMSSVNNEQSVRQARREEAARRRGDQGRDQGRNGRKKILYGATRTYSVV